jgi:hypothetical protein
MTARITDDQARDLDETRRLLYMALVAGRTKRYNLVGSIANAILHHQQVDIGVDELLDRLITFVEDGGGDDEWLRGQIKRVAITLGEDDAAI